MSDCDLEEYRSGISSLATAPRETLERSLSHLREDLNTGFYFQIADLLLELLNLSLHPVLADNADKSYHHAAQQHRAQNDQYERNPGGAEQIVDLDGVDINHRENGSNQRKKVI